MIDSPLALAASTNRTILLKGAPSTPNTQSPTAGSPSYNHPYTPGSPGNQPAHAPVTIQHGTQMSMKDGAVDLQVGKKTVFLGSDGRLEVDIPGDAITAADMSNAGGKLTLKITQIAPGSGSNAGGTGHWSLGSYLFQLVDASGVLVTHGLRKPLTVLYHYTKHQSALGLDRSYVLLNGLHPTAQTLPHLATMARGVSFEQTLGTPQSQAVQLHTTASTLVVSPQLSTPSSTLTWQGDASISTFGKPDPFNVDLNAGGLTASYPIDVPAGPGGLTPPVNLSYSSEAVNGQHNPSGAAGWVGEGWSLSAGSINWQEHNVSAGCVTNCPPGNIDWQNSWSMSDAYGTSSDLIPPNITTSTYYDDTPEFYCAMPAATYTCPIQWHTANESHDKIEMYVGPINTLPLTNVNPPCFRVWLPNGIMEEFGCTLDSLQYYYEAGLGTPVSAWNLDLITDPQGNQIHFTYQQDLANWTNPADGKVYTYPRDSVLSSIQYDSPGCRNAQTMCTGASWAPQMQVLFTAGHSVTHLTGTAPTGCNTGTNLRCDDPLDLSGSGGVAAPSVQSTFVLNSIQVQVRSSGTASWNTLRSYTLSYAQSAPTQVTDQVTDKALSVAGLLDLTQWQQVGSDGSTTLPASTFSYSAQTNYYEDSGFHPNPTTNCGPSDLSAWNTGNGSGCLLWGRSNLNTNQFLSSVSNGQGLAQTFSWMLARNNTHGVNGGGANTADTFYCDSHQSGYPCNEADDNGWSHVVLSQKSDTTIRLTQSGQGGTQTRTPVTSTTSYSYLLSYPLASMECSDCVAGFYWGPENDGDYLSYYNSKFMGFAQATVSLPDGSKQVHKYYATEGWGVYDTTKVQCLTTNQYPCHNAPWWDLNNAGHGHEYQTLDYDVDGTTLLKEVDATYQAICPPAGVAATPPSSTWGDWHGNLVGQLDHTSPIAVCDIQQIQQATKVYDGSSSSVTTTTSYTYDTFGRTTQETTTTNGGTPGKVVKNTAYVWNAGISATQTSASGTYIIDTPAFADVEDGSGNRLSCDYTSYDGQAYATGQMSNLTGGLKTTNTAYAYCGTSSNSYTPSGPSTTTMTYDVYGDAVGTTDADATAGISGHTGCSIDNIQYTTCATFESTFGVFPISTSNVFNQTSSTSYSNTSALFGFGTWQTSDTDLNGQTTSYTYDALGRMTGDVLPGETSGDLTKQWVYANWCSGMAAQAPCEEIDEIDRLDSNSTVTKRAFYDGEGRLVETRAPGPVGQDVVTFAYYDSSDRVALRSNSYFVTAYTGAPGSAAYSIPDSTQPGTSTTYTNLRQTSVTDSNSHTTTNMTSVICSVPGTSDTGCYAQSMIVDANGHESASLTGGLGKTNYTQRYTGTSGSYALYATTTLTNDAAGNLLSTKSPDGSIASATYNALGQVVSQSDPDHGVTTLTYDPNGNVTESVDARGSAGTVFAGYDGLNRPVWRNSTNSPTGAWVSFTYDSIANGNDGAGKLTGESFTGSGGLSGSYAYTFDARGQQTQQVITVNGNTFTVQASYNDAGMITSQTYPTGEVITPTYDANGWLSSEATTLNSHTTTLVSNLAYSGLAGAAGKITSMAVGNGDTATFAYDTGMRLTSTSMSLGSTLLYQSQPAYDAANNVVSVQTSINSSTDTQQFCYDALNRLTWAGATGTPPCASLTPGTLTAAQYQQSDSYTVDGGFVTGPSGTYTYGNSSHPHAVTSTSGGYSAAYDATGNLTCRAPNSSTTCSSTQTGQQLGYDGEGRLTSWQNTPTSPTQTVNYLYDGSGQRIATTTTVSGTTTLVVYIGSIEEWHITGTTSKNTTFYEVGGHRLLAKVNGLWFGFGYDALGSQVAVMNGSGSIVGSQLYGPYGNQRYHAGTLSTDVGFTGQLVDTTTGLDYYVARYLDPVTGMFLSPDSVQGNAQGMDPYAYVGDDPETKTDPTGQRFTCGPDCGSGGGSGTKTGVHPCMGKCGTSYYHCDSKCLAKGNQIEKKVHDDLLNRASQLQVDAVALKDCGGDVICIVKQLKGIGWFAYMATDLGAAFGGVVGALLTCLGGNLGCAIGAVLGTFGGFGLQQAIDDHIRGYRDGLVAALNATSNMFSEWALEFTDFNPAKTFDSLLDLGDSINNDYNTLLNDDHLNAWNFDYSWLLNDEAKPAYNEAWDAIKQLDDLEWECCLPPDLPGEH